MHYYWPVRHCHAEHACVLAGTSGFVQLAWDEEDSTQVAIKFVARGSAYLSRAAEREILNHRLLTGHAHIVQFKEVPFRTFGMGLAQHGQQN